jgi:carbonic anhydrase/acetyltransferase-like protein (isoleucine patch superfamily)
MSQTVLPYLEHRPVIGADVYIADTARLIGRVTVGDASSIWYNCVLRGDINFISIGHHTNIQDATICHLADDYPCIVGHYCTVGHNVILHGCTVGDEVLVGMGAILMNGVEVGSQSIIGAGALLTEGLHVPTGSLVYGSPAKVVSALGETERRKIRGWAEKYCRVAANHRASGGQP